jgi:hypothetical protein
MIDFTTFFMLLSADFGQKVYYARTGKAGP